MKRALLCALLLLAGCEDAPHAYTAKPLTFSQPPIQLAVREIKVVDAYQSPLTRPHVEQDFPTPLESAVKTWAGQRLRASPSNSDQGVLEITITDASAVAVPLKKTEGIKGVFTDDQDTRYDASLKVTFRLYSGAQAMSDASGDVVVTRSHTINEKATVYDRQQLLDSMAHDMMTTFDAQADARLRQYFSKFIR